MINDYFQRLKANNENGTGALTLPPLRNSQSQAMANDVSVGTAAVGGFVNKLVEELPYVDGMLGLANGLMLGAAALPLLDTGLGLYILAIAADNLQTGATIRATGSIPVCRSWVKARPPTAGPIRKPLDS